MADESKAAGTKEPGKKKWQKRSEKEVFAAARDEALGHGMQATACAFAELAGESMSPAEPYKDSTAKAKSNE